MAIIIKEILVRATITAGDTSKGTNEDALLQMKKDIIKEVKETIRKERMQKQER
ncbi:DUF5908 family protein [Flavobacterium sp. DGU11]|uniref:DUF5908 family protein n=1 Tax=Flavobacterium arundinis TaxID=3139143 RepID=A0ABU9HRM6_9FLAO